MTQFSKIDKYGECYRIEIITESERDLITDRVNRDSESGNKRILPGPHSEERMDEYNVSFKDVEWVLRFGSHLQTRFYKKDPDTPRHVFKGRDFDGLREIKVAIIELVNNIIIVTVMN